MSTELIFSFIALGGLVIFLAGVLLWLGLPAALMILGTVMVYAGLRWLPTHKEGAS